MASGKNSNKPERRCTRCSTTDPVLLGLEVDVDADGACRTDGFEMLPWPVLDSDFAGASKGTLVPVAHTASAVCSLSTARPARRGCDSRSGQSLSSLCGTGGAAERGAVVTALCRPTSGIRASVKPGALEGFCVKEDPEDTGTGAAAAAARASAIARAATLLASRFASRRRIHSASPTLAGRSRATVTALFEGGGGPQGREVGG